MPVVQDIGCELKRDVLRRDFTVNAIAKSVMTDEVVDYTGGLKDIEAKLLRVLHDNSFIDDPTRIVRALKFAVRFGFELEENTLKLQQEYLENIRYYCIVMSENYIRNHFADIKKYASVIENRGDDTDCTLESVLADHAQVLELAQKHKVNYLLIDDKYEIDIDL